MLVPDDDNTGCFFHSFIHCLLLHQVYPHFRRDLVATICCISSCTWARNLTLVLHTYLQYVEKVSIVLLRSNEVDDVDGDHVELEVEHELELEVKHELHLHPSGFQP